MNTRDWKELYRREYESLESEGIYYKSFIMPINGEYPDPTAQLNDEETDAKYWELACHHLLEARRQPNAEFQEPTAWKDIEAEQMEVSFEGKLEDDAAYLERLSGAVHGRIAGVLLGKPFETNMSREEIRRYLESVGEYPLREYASAYSEKLGIGLRDDCIPSTKGNVSFAQADDDLNYTVLALRIAEKHGLTFTSFDPGYNMIHNVPLRWIWGSSRIGYYDLLTMTKLSDTHYPTEYQLATIPWTVGGESECIDGQIKGDFWGYICPGDPRMASKLAYKDCAFSLVKNGVYGGMFVAGCIATAMTKNPTVERILEGGLSVIPPKSRLSESIQWTMDQYAHCHDYLTVCQGIEERYGHYGFAGTINNLSIVSLALLCGDLNYSDTITLAVSAGFDTDCNGGTAGSICGAAVGRKGIEDRWIAPLNDTLKTCVADVGQISIQALIDRIAAIHYKSR